MRSNDRARSRASRSIGSSRARRRLWPPEAMNKALSRRQAETLAAETLETELARIAALSFDDLRAFWLKMTGQGAPRALSRELLARMIAHRIQEQRLGKLRREMRQRLDGLARGGGEPARALKAGPGVGAGQRGG